ncbi:MAG TPA: hypothetical protein VNJ02_04920 [Vicinamibacterales bacterium]|nr:hypothetical protein [Vicinamibacterales bacterium]
MSRRAFFTECQSQLWLDVAKRLQTEHDLTPVYWIGKRVFAPVVRLTFPTAVFHARTDAIRGIPPAACRDLPQRPLDAAFFAEYASVLITAGKMMDRLDPGDGFRYEERTRLFEVQARYWRGVLEHFRPDIVLFPVQPHTVYDYIIYELCRRMGVQTTMFQWTLFTDWIYPIDHIDRGYGELEARTRVLERDPQPHQLHPRVAEYLRKVTGTYAEGIPSYLMRLMPDALRQELFGALADDDNGLLTGQQQDAADPAAVIETEPAVPASVSPAPEPVRPIYVIDLWPPRRAYKILRKRARRNVHVARVEARDFWRHSHRAARLAIKRAEQRTEPVRHALRPRQLRRSWRKTVEQPRRARKTLWAFYKRWFRHLVYALRHGDVDRPLKERDRPFDLSFRGRTGAFRLQWLRVRGTLAKRRFFRYYAERCGELRYDEPYVFVALHYQPEQTTCPTGGIFMDQLLLVQMLSQLLPDGWRLLVKEHPYQFFTGSVGERGRTLDFYDDLAAIPKVTLVPWSVSPFTLIDRSMAVANVTGTTGLEAVIRGKPVLAFGYAWYRPCHGVFYTPTIAACRAALDAIIGGFEVDPLKVRAFLKAVEEVSFRADLGFGERIEAIPHQENVEAVLNGFRRRLDAGAGQARGVEHGTAALA